MSRKPGSIMIYETGNLVLTDGDLTFAADNDLTAHTPFHILEKRNGCNAIRPNLKYM
jgi:hypothetical protein